MNFAGLSLAEAGYIRRWRRRLHQHPELSLQERRTTEALAGALEAMGLPVHRFAGHTGLVAELCGGRPGRRLLLRADIDALPIREASGLAYASRNGAMHACGHDCHAAMLLGAAKLLLTCRAGLCGSVRLLFQAAEETARGSLFYIRQGCLEGVDAAFGLHIWSGLEAPKISIEPGPRMASCDNFTLTVRGAAAHGAVPHLGADAIVAAAAAVTQLQAYVARRHDAQEPLVVSIGAIHGGEACNILAERVSLLGTARCFSPALRARLEAELSSLFSAACQALGCRADLDWQPTAGPVINADARLLALGRGAVEKLYGPEGLGLLPPLMCAEDFSYYSARVPTLFAFLGGGNPALGAVHPHHSPHFCIDEAALPRGAALYAQFAWDYLNGSAAP